MREEVEARIRSRMSGKFREVRTVGEVMQANPKCKCNFDYDPLPLPLPRPIALPFPEAKPKSK